MNPTMRHPTHTRTISGRGIFDTTKKRQPRAEVYGFAIWIASFIVYGLYLLWAYTPESWLQMLYITYYPDKYWAVAFPCYMLSVNVALFFSSILYHHFRTKPLDSKYTFEDESSLRDDNTYQIDQVPPFSDLPIEKWNEMLLAKLQRKK
jgi:phosphatidylinositol glycan class P protein